MCYIGDGNNMANSLIVGGLKTGMKVSIATPVDYRPDAELWHSQSRTRTSSSPMTDEGCRERRRCYH